MKQFVQHRSAPELAQRLWAWAEADSDFMAELKAWAAQAAVVASPKAAANAVNLKSAISDLLASPDFISWREAASYAHRAAKVLPLIQAVLASDPVQALALCDHALRCLFKVSEDADDSGGDIGDVMQTLIALLLRCLKAAPPPGAWVEDWFAMMKADPWGVWSENDVLDVAGDAVRASYSQRVANDWQAWVARHPPVDAAASPGVKPKVQPAQQGARLPVHVPYDAERVTLHRRYLDDLKRQGETGTALAFMQANLTGADAHSELVKYCESVGKTRDAAQFAKAAYLLFPGDWRSEADLLRCYERDACTEEALAIRRLQLEKQPSVERYEAVLQAAKQAKQNVPAYREDLFAWAQSQEMQQENLRHLWAAKSSQKLSAKASARHVDTRVKWLLSEGHVDQALALVQSPNVCQMALLHEVAKKLPTERDAQAVPLLLRVFAATMPQASSPYSGELALVLETALRMPQPHRSQWLALLRAEYRAKRNFIKGLDVLKIPA